MSTGGSTTKHKDRDGLWLAMEAASGIVPPDQRKFEREKKEIINRIKELEDNIRLVSSSAALQVSTDISNETGKLSEFDKSRESYIADVKAVEANIREVGLKYSEKKRVASDFLAGVRHKTEGRHDDAVERLEQHLTMRKCSSLEEKKFKQEVEALKKSKERLGRYLVAKNEVDIFKEELEMLRSRRDSLHRSIKEQRSKELVVKDKVEFLRHELEEVKEKKKISISERNKIRKEIDSLQQCRRQLCNKFREEQMAYLAAINKQKQLQIAEDKQRRDQSRAAREEQRAVARDFHLEQEYDDWMATCRALLSHLQKLSLTTHIPLDIEEEPSQSQTAIPLLDQPPLRSRSAPSTKPGDYILRRDKEEMLLNPSSLTRKKSIKKEKRRNTPLIKVYKKLQLNASIFRQFTSLELIPPSTVADIPHAIAQLNDKLAYFENVIKQGISPSSCQESETADSGIQGTAPSEMLDVPLYIESDMADSGVGSTAPSEMPDIPDHDTEFTISQEDGILNLDPGLGATVPASPKRSLLDVISPTIPDPERSQLPTSSDCSATANGSVSALEEPLAHAASNGRNGLVAMAPACANSISFSTTSNED